MNHPDRHTSSDATSAAGPHDPVNFANWAKTTAPHLSEVSNSNPNARLHKYNFVAFTDDTETGRAVALDFERVPGEGTDTSMLVLGHHERRESRHRADPEGVTTHAAKRTLIGGLPGAVIAALIIGVGVWLLTESTPATFAAVVGGAIFGFYVTAVWSYVIGTGQSRAFQQGFVDPDAAEAIIVAFHADEQSLIEDARRSIDHVDNVRIYEVDAQGQPTV